MASNVSTRRVNVTLGSGRAVHLGSALTVDGVAYTASPICGGNRAAERYFETGREATCKRCIRALGVEQAAAEEAAYAEQAQRDQAEAAAADPRVIETTVVTVDLVEPTKGLLLAVTHLVDGHRNDYAGTVLHNSLREGSPDAGWSAENEYGEQVASRMSCLEAAVTAWAMSEGLIGRLRIDVCHEYAQTGQRDEQAAARVN